MTMGDWSSDVCSSDLHSVPLSVSLSHTISGGDDSPHWFPFPSDSSSFRSPSSLLVASSSKPQCWPGHSAPELLSETLHPQGACVSLCAKLLHSCRTLWDTMDCSLPGSSVHGILQARVLEWGAMPSSRGSNPGLLHCRWILYRLSHQGGPDSG